MNCPCVRKRVEGRTDPRHVGQPRVASRDHISAELEDNPTALGKALRHSAVLARARVRRKVDLVTGLRLEPNFGNAFRESDTETTTLDRW